MNYETNEDNPWWRRVIVGCYSSKGFECIIIEVSLWKNLALCSNVIRVPLS